MNKLKEGAKVRIINKHSEYFGEWGTVRMIDGSEYHIALWNDKYSALVFDAKEITADVEPNKLKERREASGLSQSQLAEKAGLSKRTLQELEQGRRDINGVKLLTLLKICQAMQCKLEDIVTDPEIIDLLKTVS